MAFSMDNITSSASNLIGGGVKFIGDGVSNVTKTIGGFFAGDGPLDSLGSDSTAGTPYLFQYPETLGTSGANDTMYESDPEKDDSWMDHTPDAGSQRSAVLGVDFTTGDPFITFAFKEISTTMADVQQQQLASQDLAAGVIATTAVSAVSHGASNLAGDTKVTKAAANTATFLVGAKYVLDAVHAISKTIDEKPKRFTRARVALYMPNGIQVTDSANYDPLSKKSLAFMAELDKTARDENGDIKFDKSKVDPLNPSNFGNPLHEWDAKGDFQIAAAAMLGETMAGGGLIAGAMSAISPAAMGTLAAMGTTIKLVGDEELRMLGKAINPNEYMQFKSTSLRQFSLSFKFLPDSPNESRHVKEIIKTFREALYPIKHSGISMTVPDVLQLQFHNVSGMILMPDLGLTNVNISYNPNAASFFKESGQPVEISMDITMQELYPLHRDDITMGY